MSSWAEKCANWLQKLGCEEKRKPGTTSASRVIAYVWALTCVLYVGISVFVMETHPHTPTLSALIGGALTALGLRSKAPAE